MALFEAKPKPKKISPFIEVGQFNDKELPVASLIQRRRLQMLVHSKIYYDFNNSIITDKQFDDWGRELVGLQQKHPEVAKEICYHDAFKDWDASTGTFLPLQDEWVVRKATQILAIAEKKGDVNEHKKIQQSPRKTGSEKPKRKKDSKQRGNSLF